FTLMLKPHNCGIHFKDGVLQVLPREVIDEVTMKMEIYDCRDILYPIQSFPGVDLDLSTISGTSATPADDVAGGEIPIEEMVRAHTGGRSWDENPKASIKMQNG